MSVLAEAMIAAFDSSTKITWATRGLRTALASFTYRDLLVTVTFAQVNGEEWQVGFDVAPDSASVNAGVHNSIRIFSGVFQAVREFLEVRQPARLVFASKQEALGHLYETYMQRQDTELAQLGYRMVITRVEPLVEFALKKLTPSAWNGS